MSERIALFPLGTALFPGLVLPLHVFEPRYRELVADLLAMPEPREFGVVAIRQGRETGIDGVQSLYEIGCTAVLQEVETLPDGRSNLVTVGGRRFRLLSMEDTRSYFQGDVDFLDDSIGDPAAAALVVPPLQQAFSEYVETLAARVGTSASTPELPSDPLLLSYVVAVSMVVDLADKQSLLEEPDAVSRLTAERALLARELTMLRTLTAAPAPGLTRTPYNPN